MNINLNNRLNIRVSQQSLAFAVADPHAVNQVIYEPCIVKSGISIAANMREAFKHSELLNRGYDHALLIIDTPTMLVPLKEFDEEKADLLYHHAISGYENCEVLHQVLPHLNAVVLYPINRDLKLVVGDHFSDVRYAHVMEPAWNHMLSRSYTGNRRKLYCYFHDGKVDVFSFDKNRFRFSNAFDASYSRDSVYYILHVWKQLGYDAQTDELYLVYDQQQPDTADVRQNREWTLEALRRYLGKAYVINPSAEFNRAPVTLIKGIPFDLMVLFVKG
ncbi:MAG: DUF3822 family protein [Prevotella sp.]|nr:DUF3822 family protein [Prevotella sp.]